MAEPMEDLKMLFEHELASMPPGITVEDAADRLCAVLKPMGWMVRATGDVVSEQLNDDDQPLYRTCKVVCVDASANLRLDTDG